MYNIKIVPRWRELKEIERIEGIGGKVVRVKTDFYHAEIHWRNKK